MNIFYTILFIICIIIVYNIYNIYESYREKSTHFNKNGKPKISYTNEDDAVNAAINFGRIKQSKMSSYRCGLYPDEWHIGNKK